MTLTNTQASQEATDQQDVLSGLRELIKADNKVTDISNTLKLAKKVRDLNVGSLSILGQAPYNDMAPEKLIKEFNLDVTAPTMSKYSLIGRVLAKFTKDDSTDAVDVWTIVGSAKSKGLLLDAEAHFFLMPATSTWGDFVSIVDTMVKAKALPSKVKIATETLASSEWDESTTLRIVAECIRRGYQLIKPEG